MTLGERLGIAANIESVAIELRSDAPNLRMASMELRLLADALDPADSNALEGGERP